MSEPHFIISNNGDGSSSVHVFESLEVAEAVKETDDEQYGMDEGPMPISSLKPRSTEDLLVQLKDTAENDYAEWRRKEAQKAIKTIEAL